MTYFVHYESGSCQYGDHEAGLEEFGTEDAARARCGELKESRYDISVTLIAGEELEHFDRD